MSQDTTSQWDNVYRTKSPQEVSWFQASADASLKAIDRISRSPKALIDIGGGASVLVDQLIAKGWTDLSVLDLSHEALDLSRRRLGAQGSTVEWIVADIATWRPSRRYQIWHDRAVFHFLTESADRTAYRTALEAALPPSGNAIIATFALDGPERCSGLPVVRYDAAALAKELGPSFVLIDSWDELHQTPAGSSQAFTWTLFHKA